MTSKSRQLKLVINKDRVRTRPWTLTKMCSALFQIPAKYTKRLTDFQEEFHSFHII